MALDRKFEFIRPWIEGKRVLDLGCVDHSASIEHTSDWMHKKLSKSANYLLGVDILDDEIKILKQRGYNVQVGDVQNLTLDEKFDVIFAGEIIEHLTNFEGFFNSIIKNLVDGGVVILTTPNVFSFSYFLYALFNRPTCRKEHTCWFDFTTISNLLLMFNFKLISVKFIRCTSFREVLLSIKNHSLKDVIVSIFSYLIENFFPERVGSGDMVIIAKYKENKNEKKYNDNRKFS